MTHIEDGMGNRSRLRLGVEVLAVIFSILAAFGIDAWWDDQQATRSELAALEGLRGEFFENRERLAERILTNFEAMEVVGEFFRASPADVRLMPAEEAAQMAVDIWAPYTFDPAVGATTSFLARGPAVTKQGERVRRAVTEWQTAFLDAGEELAVLWNASREVLGLQTEHVADLAPPEGLRPTLFTLMMVGGPARLARMRADERLMSATVAKIHLQTIYTGELAGLAELGDSVLVQLDVDMSALAPFEAFVRWSPPPTDR